ncbi:LON peptidase substrate-binding domain-containing protein [Nitrospina gracilis]|uniref:LON peptidase substrate-binding domain-containing protein n=1 Tax=Nitrospina gracilis TaxID=35801 RepID=UPI001F44C148|nr:LON peptidase substrate-binding domain-containing protein [Nitrospina gracilis]MCF8721547.1 Lon protease-like protein [Nitrospina gracilis Nb-211]
MTDSHSGTTPKRISLFPLPTSVFYPKTYLPLHIFEPRYRKMIQDSIDRGQWIGMVLLEPGYEEEYFARPAIKQVGCMGNLEKWFQYDDGRFDIVLNGRSRFRIVREVGDALYREAEVEPLVSTHDTPLVESPPQLDELTALYRKFIEHLPRKNAHKVELDLTNCKTLGEAVDRVAYMFDSALDQKQTFLEEPDVLKRLELIKAQISLKLEIVQRARSFSKVNWDVRMN